MATDDFNRADGGLGANWTTPTSASALSISSNEAAGPGSGIGLAARTAETYEDDQYSRCECVNTTRDKGPAVRMATGSDNCYLTSDYNGNNYLMKRFGGSWTQLNVTGGGAPSAGQLVEINASGTTIKVVVAPTDGPPATTGSMTVSGTDSSIASGYPGLFMGVSGCRQDDWSGGPETAGGAITGDVSATMPAWTAVLDGTVSTTGALAATMPAWTSSTSGSVDIEGDLAISLGAFTASLESSGALTGELAATFPAFTAALEGTLPITGDLAAAMPAWTALLRELSAGGSLPAMHLYRRLLLLLNEEDE